MVYQLNLLRWKEKLFANNLQIVQLKFWVWEQIKNMILLIKKS